MKSAMGGEARRQDQQKPPTFRKTNLSEGHNGQSTHQQGRNNAQNREQRRPPERVANPFAAPDTSRSKPSAGTGTSTGWGAGATATKPLEYGDIQRRNEAARRNSAIQDIDDYRAAQRNTATSQVEGQKGPIYRQVYHAGSQDQESQAEPKLDSERAPLFYDAPLTQTKDDSSYSDVSRPSGETVPSAPSVAEEAMPNIEERTPSLEPNTDPAEVVFEANVIPPVTSEKRTPSIEPSSDPAEAVYEANATSPAASPASTQPAASASSDEWIGFGFEEEDEVPEIASQAPVEAPEVLEEQYGGAQPDVAQQRPKPEPPQRPASSQDARRDHRQTRLSDTGYRAMPFDPREVKPLSSEPEASTGDWQHLRRKTTEPVQEPQPPPEPQQQPNFYRPTQQKQRSEFDSRTVDEIFAKHQRQRPQRQPSRQTETADQRESRSLFDGFNRSQANVKCARCGDHGHIARDCKQQVVCFACGQVGHTAPQCPQSKREAGRRPNPFEDPTADWRGRSQSSSVFNPFERADRTNQYQQRAQQDSDTSRQGFGAFDRASSQRTSKFPEPRTEEASGRGAGPMARTSRWANVEQQEDERDQDGARRRDKSARASRWADEDEEDSRDTGRRNGKKAGRRKNEDDDDEGSGAREEYRMKKSARREQQEAERKRQREARKAEGATPIALPEFISVQNLSQMLDVRYEEFVQRLEELGYDDIFPGKTLNSETSGMIAMEYNYEPSFESAIRDEEERDLKARPVVDDTSLLPVRPPVVTIMGHVDHGKTTILDYLRKSSVAAGEAGGITQHIGAFSVPLASSGKTITFLDTPGHAAFLAMRQRGANVTDLVILVVAADDSVKPQTLEAIKHAKAAGVPMVVAINKVDKPEADIDRCKQDLARHGVEIEDFGGDTQVVAVSGKTGQGMDDLEETVVTLSEILDHRADREGEVEGWVIEATTKSNGRVATVLVRRGTLEPGAVLVAGRTWARVKTLTNETGKTIEKVGPGMPVEVDGWRDQPVAGDEVLEAPSEQKATTVVEFRRERQELERTTQDTEAINKARKLARERHEADKAAEKAAKQAARQGDDGEAVASTQGQETRQEEPSGQMVVPFIIKADVSGSMEAVAAYIMSVSSPLIAPQVLHSGVGNVHESDVELASVAQAHIIAFNLPPNEEMKGLAESKGVKVLENNIIYRVLDDVRAVLEEKLPPIVTQRVLGEAEIGASFDIGVGGRKKMKIAGCKIRNGVVSKGSRARVMRGGEKVYDGEYCSALTLRVHC